VLAKLKKEFCLSVFSKIAIAVAFTALASTNAFATKVGYVQMKSIMQSQQSLDIGKRLVAEFKPRTAELEKIRSQIIEKEAALEKEAPKMSQKDLVAKRQELDRQKIDLDRKKTKQHEDFEIRKREELNNFQNNVNAAVTALGQTEGFDLILYNTGGYIGPRVDITDKVLKALK
jgi:outer membrane protein